MSSALPILLGISDPGADLCGTAGQHILPGVAAPELRASTSTGKTCHEHSSLLVKIPTVNPRDELPV